MLESKPDQRKIDYLRSRLRKWGRSNYVDYPWRRTNNLWHAIVAEIMLQRTRAEQVLPEYLQFCKKFITPEAFVNYSKDNEITIFNSLGLRWRNDRIKETGNYLAEKGIPDTREELLKVPGIGDYVASAILSFHLNRRELLIDSNIVRFLGRYFGFEFGPETRRKKEFRELVDLVTPTIKVGTFNYAMLDFSMNICAPRPDCSICPLSKKCKYIG